MRKMRISFVNLSITLSLLLSFQLVNGQEKKENWTLYPPANPEMDSETVDSLALDSSQALLPDSSYQSELIEDARLEYLMDKYLTLNEGKVNGFRIQIFAVSGANSSAEARKVNAEFKQSGIKLPSYIEFDNPNFWVRVGDFRTRLEAEKFRILVQEKFPSAYLVVDDINLPPLAQD